MIDELSGNGNEGALLNSRDVEIWDWKPVARQVLNGIKTIMVQYLMELVSPIVPSAPSCLVRLPDGQLAVAHGVDIATS